MGFTLCFGWKLSVRSGNSGLLAWCPVGWKLPRRLGFWPSLITVNESLSLQCFDLKNGKQSYICGIAPSFVIKTGSNKVRIEKVIIQTCLSAVFLSIFFLKSQKQRQKFHLQFYHFSNFCFSKWIYQMSSVLEINMYWYENGLYSRFVNSSLFLFFKEIELLNVFK